MKALVTVGILMAYVGNSRPASGSEHHLSHYFEIVGILNDEPYFPHGVDVCYSAIETCKIREQVLAIKNIDELEYSFDKADYEANIKRVYTSIADEIFALQNKMGWYDVDRVKVYKEKWDEVCKVLSESPTSAQMLEYVERVGLKYDEFVKLYGEKKIADGVRYAKDLKDRYTVLWTLFELVK